MDAEIKKHIVRLLSTGHKHEEMTKMLECSYCGERFQQAQDQFEKLKKIYPEKFGYEMPQPKESQKTLAMQDQLEERIKTDIAYRKHFEVMTQGKAEEQIKEWRKEKYYAQPR